MNSSQPDMPPPPPYQEHYTTVQPSAYAYDVPIQTISYPKAASQTRNQNEADDCCDDCECNAFLQCLNSACNLCLCFLCCLECCAICK